jgi:hypothetical protein
MDDIKEVLELVHDLKDMGVIGDSVARSFCHLLIQPIKDRVHPAYEYWGQSDPPREANRKVPKEEVMARVSQIYAGRTRIKKFPKVYSFSRPADLVSHVTTRSFALSRYLHRSYFIALYLLQDWEVQFWCLTPLLKGEEPRRKLRLDKYQPPAVGLLENYESDSSVEADEDTNPKVGDDAVNRQEASTAAKPRRKTRAVTAKQSATTAAAKVGAAKTTKLEVEKKKRKRRVSLPPTIETLTIPMPSSREVEDEEDEATDDPPIVEDRVVRISLSPAAKRQWEIEQKAMEAQRAATGAQEKMLVLIKVQPFRPKLRAPTAVSYGCSTEGFLLTNCCWILYYV